MMIMTPTHHCRVLADDGRTTALNIGALNFINQHDETGIMFAVACIARAKFASVPVEKNRKNHFSSSYYYICNRCNKLYI